VLPTRRCCSATRWKGVAVPFLPLRQPQLQRPRNGIRYELRVVGINQQGIPTFGNGTGEPRKNCGRRRRSGCSRTSAWKTMSQPTICCGRSFGRDARSVEAVL
jgi:hypothetical protein